MSKFSQVGRTPHGLLYAKAGLPILAGLGGKHDLCQFLAQQKRTQYEYELQAGRNEDVAGNSTATNVFEPTHPVIRVDRAVVKEAARAVVDSSSRDAALKLNNMLHEVCKSHAGRPIAPLFDPASGADQFALPVDQAVADTASPCESLVHIGMATASDINAHHTSLLNWIWDRQHGIVKLITYCTIMDYINNIRYLRDYYHTDIGSDSFLPMASNVAEIQSCAKITSIRFHDTKSLIGFVVSRAWQTDTRDMLGLRVENFADWHIVSAEQAMVDYFEEHD